MISAQRCKRNNNSSIAYRNSATGCWHAEESSPGWMVAKIELGPRGADRGTEGACRVLKLLSS